MTSRGAPLRRVGQLALASALLASPAPASAQRPPVIRYTVANGLAHNNVDAVFQDSRGYIWFATHEGVSRFDGYEFVTFGVEDGLPHPLVTGILEDARGRLGVSTAGHGLAFMPAEDRGGESSRAFEPVAVDGGPDGGNVMAAALDRDGTIWCVASSGVYRATPGESRPVSFTRVLASGDATWGAAHVDRRGRVWLGVGRDLFVAVNGGLVRVARDTGLGRFDIAAFAEADDGRLFVANTHEVWELAPSAPPAEPAAWRRLPLAVDGPRHQIRSMAVDPAGRLWIATTRGLVWWVNGAQSSPDLGAALEGWLEGVLRDRDGNLWVGTHGNGAVRVSAGSLASYTTTNGLPAADVQGVVEADDGAIYASTVRGVVVIRDGQVIEVPGGSDPRFLRIGARFVQDGQGSWWLGTEDGVAYWVPPGELDLRRARPVFAARPTGQWPWAPVTRDASGDVWIMGPDTLMRAALVAGQPRLEPVALGSSVRHLPIGRVARDRSGALWLSSHAGLTRLGDGRADEVVSAADPEMLGRALYVDSRGWLWIGLRYRGVLVTKDPSAARPEFEQFTVKDGLGSNTVWAIAEGRDGRMYFGTGHGLDRFDPSTRVIVQTHVADGLAGAPVTHLMTARDGRIWISTPSGLSVLDPAAHGEAPRTPPVYFTRLQIDGRDWPIARRGVESLGPLRLTSGRNSLLIEFVGLSFRSGHPLRYQYRLDGIDTGWSPPTTQRTVAFAHLAPGAYRFLVRAVSEEGLASDPPASVELIVPAPVWRRAWFLGLVALALLGLGAALNHLRTRQVLAMERIRRQVALDLHDDVGAGLSQIAILSEVGREETGDAAASLWAEVGALSRGLRESMSDIVWAVDPRHDSLVDLVRRMKQVAFNLLQADGCVVRFELPDEETMARHTLAPDRRRHVLLVFKEAVHNTTRHAAARAVRIAVTLEAGGLRLLVEDDGRGFDPGRPTDGHGLDSLRRRARALGATLEIASRPGVGTAVRLAVPLG